MQHHPQMPSKSDLRRLRARMRATAQSAAQPTPPATTTAGRAPLAHATDPGRGAQDGPDREARAVGDWFAGATSRWFSILLGEEE